MKINTFDIKTNTKKTVKLTKKREFLWLKKYSKHLPALFLSFVFWIMLAYIFFFIDPRKIKYSLFVNFYALFLFVFFLALFFLCSFLILNSRRGFIIAFFLTGLLFMKFTETFSFVWGSALFFLLLVIEVLITFVLTIRRSS